MSAAVLRGDANDTGATFAQRTSSSQGTKCRLSQSSVAESERTTLSSQTSIGTCSNESSSRVSVTLPTHDRFSAAATTTTTTSGLNSTDSKSPDMSHVLSLSQVSSASNALSFSGEGSASNTAPRGYEAWVGSGVSFDRSEAATRTSIFGESNERRSARPVMLSPQMTLVSNVTSVSSPRTVEDPDI